MSKVDITTASPYKNVTARWERFCYELLNTETMNPTEAVRRTDCYSHKHAKQQAWRLLKRPQVRLLIAQLIQERSENLFVSSTDSE